MNRKQRRNARRSIRLRGDGTEKTTRQEPPATRRTKRMLVPSMSSAMVRHAEEMQKPKGMLADLAAVVAEDRSAAQLGGGENREQAIAASTIEVADLQGSTGSATIIIPHNEQAPCASLYGGCAPECGAGNRCQAEQRSPAQVGGSPCSPVEAACSGL